MAPDEDTAAPARTEAVSLAIAGPAFALCLWLLRHATPVPSVFFVSAAALVAGWGLAPLVQLKGHAPAATLVRGASLILATMLLARALGDEVAAAALPLGLALAGATVLQADARSAAPRWSAATVGGVLLVAGLALGLRVAEALPRPDALRTALLAMAFLSLAGMGARLSLLRSRHADLAPTPAGLIAAALLLGVYAGYRPLAAERVDNLPLYEWALAVSIALLVFARIRRTTREAQTPEAWSWDARRHAQDVRPLYDTRMTPLAAAIQRWLDQGEGLDDYRRALENATGRPIPPHLAQALEAGRGTRGVLPKARREAAQRRAAAHEAALKSLIDPRGATHGSVERTLRPNP